MQPDYTVNEVARLMGVHPDTIRRLARAGRLSGCYRIGKQLRFRRDAIARMRGEVALGTYSSAQTDLGNLALTDADPQDGEEVTGWQ